jgi:hypothetical protein
LYSDLIEWKNYLTPVTRASKVELFIKFTKELIN